MPLCAYGDSRMRTDHTDIENVFIREFMPSANGDAVKVYLYGLMQCQHDDVGKSTIYEFADALYLSEKDVRNAFLYWEECGLVNVTTSPSFSVLYLSAKHAMPSDNSVYTFSKMNAQLQSMFLPAALLPSELARIYEWIDVFHIEHEAVVLLINYGREKMKANISKATVSHQLRYIDKIAKQWADEGIYTAELADKWIRFKEKPNNGITNLLKRLGLNRYPTLAEREIYKKWLDMGFNDQTILLAADRTIGIRNPSLDSIDNILAAFKKQGIQTQEELKNEDSEMLCKEALVALGLKQPTPSASQLDTYREWLNNGYNHEHILLSCELCREMNHRTMRDVTNCLERWRRHNLKDGKSIRIFEATRKQNASLMEQVFACMGMNKQVVEVDLEQYNEWANEWRLSDELILLAAENSHGANSPYRMIKRLLQSWHDAGIQSVSAARKQLQSPTSLTQNPALRYEQRDVSDLDKRINWD